MKCIEIKTLEVAGFVSAFDALRLSYGKEPRSAATFNVMKLGGPFVKGWAAEWHLDPDEKDLELIARLIKSGDEHAKVCRGIVAWAAIKAPVYWWAELETYRAGHERLMSESTMHIDCKGLTGEELRRAKSEMPMGKMLTKIDSFSYQTLRRIYIQRKNHRLPEWHDFNAWVESLPLAEELILPGLNEKTCQETL